MLFEYQFELTLKHASQPLKADAQDPFRHLKFSFSTIYAAAKRSWAEKVLAKNGVSWQRWVQPPANTKALECGLG
eukprot:CAMPEP_0182869936 /NCGR_PEP_ID=MMETSP0034_2-20130328/10231_1 /TAXON_ID=156128 /ORGANISM="Nephroselmis pyriformis, Strain CCMP717" /LENGTH=74 /DNA_ID=CAMNT_0025002419 /DNA_START=84 /DNA_END=308 /DNA_ORIENTATION=-